MSDYVIAILSYNRAKEITTKSLPTLKRGKVPREKIHVFVANKQQEKLYREKLDPTTYGKIVVGVKGIAQQRKFISQYFPECQYIVSVDDDLEDLLKLKGDKLAPVRNLDAFFKMAYKKMKKERLFIWGIYPVMNPFFMYNKTTTDLRFLVGVLYGYINRHDKSLYPNTKSESKDDYHHTILFFLKDGGVVRFNNYTIKTKFDAPGGLGSTGRLEKNERAAAYLHKRFPTIVTRKRRKSGKAEINLNRFAKPRQSKGTQKIKCYK